MFFDSFKEMSEIEAKHQEVDVEEANVPINTVTLEIVRVIKETQQQHGLRHGDYQRYHGYCTRRIRRLRKALNLAQGDKRHFKRRDVTEDMLVDAKSNNKWCLELVLMLAERSWAYAMQLRQEANSEPRKHFHLIKRLRKAALYAHALETLSESKVCDIRTKLESRAYKCCIVGTLSFETEQWHAAAEHLTIAEKIYNDLASSLPVDEQAPYVAKGEELSPSLRYCVYNMKAAGTGPDDAKELLAIFQGGGYLEHTDTMLLQIKKRHTEVFAEVEWRGVKLSVRSERVRMFVISMQTLNANLDKEPSLDKCINMVEAVLVECKESIGIVRDEIKTDPKLKAPRAASLTNTQMLLGYLTYMRWIYTIRRFHYLIEQMQATMMAATLQPNTATAAAAAATTTKWHDNHAIESKWVKQQENTLRFCDHIDECVRELKSIAGFEHDDNYAREMDMREMACRALTYFHAGKWFELQDKCTDAVKFYAGAIQCVTRSIDTLNTLSALDVIDYEPLLTHLGNILNGARKQKAYARAMSLEQPPEANKQKAQDIHALIKKQPKKVKLPPTIARLDQFDIDEFDAKHPNVVAVPLQLEPVPMKPLLFDLAENYVLEPDLSAKIKQHGGNAAQPGGGITGLVGKLWGWGGKK